MDTGTVRGCVGAVRARLAAIRPSPGAPPGPAQGLETADSTRMAALYEHLYKAHILRIQCANCLVYMLGGGFFVAGSTLFFPSMAEIIYHGGATASLTPRASHHPRRPLTCHMYPVAGWLYITGCVLTLAGALLAMHTAYEMKRTGMPLLFFSFPPRATAESCLLRSPVSSQRCLSASTRRRRPG